MRKWLVDVEIAKTLEIEADTEEEAQELAVDQAHSDDADALTVKVVDTRKGD